MISHDGQGTDSVWHLEEAYVYLGSKALLVISYPHSVGLLSKFLPFADNMCYVFPNRV